MKRIAAVIVLALAGAACSSTAGSSHNPSEGAPVATGSVEAQAVRMTIEELGIPFDFKDGAEGDEAIDSAGAAVCEVASQLSPLDEGDAVVIASATSKATGLTLNDSAKMAGAYIGAYCPEYLPNS